LIKNCRIIKDKVIETSSIRPHNGIPNKKRT